MIANGRQYALSEKKLKYCISLRKKLLLKLSSALNKAEALNEIDHLQREAERLTALMKDYVALITGRVSPPDLSSVSSLPRDLVRGRIALGWTEKEFSRQCGVQPSQVHRWEKNCYASVSLARILSIAAMLNSALMLQQQNPKLLGKPLKLGADWFDTDFRKLPDQSTMCTCARVVRPGKRP